MRQSWDPQEIEFRRQRYERQLLPICREHSNRDLGADEAVRIEQRPGIMPTIESFLAGAVDTETLRADIQQWAQNKPLFGFSGFAGAMSLNQIAKYADPQEADRRLRALITMPRDIDEAAAKLDEFGVWIVELRKEGCGVTLGRVPLFGSWFWWMQDPSGWRPMWSRAKNALVEFGWLEDDTEHPGDFYRSFLAVLHGLDDDHRLADHVLSFFGFPENRELLGLDPTIIERNRWVTTIPAREPSIDDVEAHRTWQARLTNAREMLLEFKRVGETLRTDLEEVFGVELKASVVGPYWVQSNERVNVRNDQYVRWEAVEDERAHPPVRLRADRERLIISIHTYHAGGQGGYTRKLRDVLAGRFPDGVDLYKQTWEPGDCTLVPEERNWTDAMITLDPSDIVTIEALRRQVRAAAEVLIEPFERAYREISAVASDAEPPPERHDLATFVATFRAATGYPDADDMSRMGEARALGAPFRKDVLAALSREQLRKVCGSRYGSPGPQANLFRTIGNADDDEWGTIIESIHYLLWNGEDPLERRIDRLVDRDDPLNVPGLGESMVMKLLVITRPDEIIPVYPFSGDKGKAAMLARLGLPVPAVDSSVGQRQIESNKTLREHLDPHFPGDLWGQSRFLYWLAEQTDASGVIEDDADERADVRTRLTEIAPELHLEPDELIGWYERLAQNRQVIFYGPPGTGKTFIAQKMAEAITSDDDHWTLVQFHPSYGYEDFVEGYRPEPAGDGFVYRLHEGPFLRMARAAENDPDEPFILIIDEINRANLPRVLGELLFLLEYRDRNVNLMYRPDEPFTLPENLWIIGTMNTADRSVALIDAAMRRRFHFIDFTPDVAGNNPIARVLGRWVEAEGQLDVLPDFVDRVNNTLAEALGGRHLILGPSYFMKKGIDEAMLRDIWELQIHPLVEDLFFGNAEMQRRFTFDALWADFAGSDEGDAQASSGESVNDVDGVDSAVDGS